MTMRNALRTYWPDVLHIGLFLAVFAFTVINGLRTIEQMDRSLAMQSMPVPGRQYQPKLQPLPEDSTPARIKVVERPEAPKPKVIAGRREGDLNVYVDSARHVVCYQLRHGTSQQLSCVLMRPK
jgi:hypothetical protein